ncbi:MAG: hypothetical protein PHV20_03480 [Bacteroidales bacterium]|nr:hypothetical protein [Bacteroidales bacterium]
MKKNNLWLTIPLCVFLLVISPNSHAKNRDTNVCKSATQGSYGYDINFLGKFDSSLIILKAEKGKAQLAISPKYQSKVFTSTAEGVNGKSFGWINYKAFIEKPNTHMNAFGGENRFWLGPEGGAFSLYFEPGTEMTFPNWHTPAPIDIEPWSILSRSTNKVTLTKQINIINYKGTSLSIKAKRSITIFSIANIFKKMGIPAVKSLKAVGYETDNSICNTGDFEWNEKTGVPCIWILDMLNPTQNTVIVVPFQRTQQSQFKDVATTNYFGEIPADRISYTENTLFFKADGKHRSKLGIKPLKVLPVAGSYDSTNKVLTIVIYDVRSNERYLNQEWSANKDPFTGDAMNAYNDGPLADGSQMGPFYEIESVSPGAFLKPNEWTNHKHSVFHFSGNESDLSKISEKMLGVSIEEIKKSLQ